MLISSRNTLTATPLVQSTSPLKLTITVSVKTLAFMNGLATDTWTLLRGGEPDGREEYYRNTAVRTGKLQPLVD
jgi:hypothetical protein